MDVPIHYLMASFPPLFESVSYSLVKRCENQSSEKASALFMGLQSWLLTFLLYPSGSSNGNKRRTKA